MDRAQRNKFDDLFLKGVDVLADYVEELMSGANLEGHKEGYDAGMHDAMKED